MNIILSLASALIFTLLPEKVLSSVTAEEGRAATLQCPGFTPTPGGDQGAVFNWYKARQGDVSTDNRVAFASKLSGIVNSERELKGRATIDLTTGALKIIETTVSDEHIYTCYYMFTTMGTVKSVIDLVITVTPSEQDLKVTANPSGPVKEGESVTVTCSASRVKPPPREMYWQFADETKHLGEYRYENNSDQLTSSVSAQYSLTVNRNRHGKKLACHFVTSTRTISSDELNIKVLSKPIGQPSVEADTKTVEAKSKVELKCDCSQVEGSATWYVWQFANGTALDNTTQHNWTYATSEEETLQFVCIAGNSLGQSNRSEPLTINVQSLGTNNLVLIIGVVIGAVLAIVFIIIGIVCFKRHRNLSADIEPEIQVNVNYNQVPDTGEMVYSEVIHPKDQKKKIMSKGEYANGNLGDGRTLTDDGLIYMQPDFANGPPNQRGASRPVVPPKPGAKPRHLTSTAYAEVDFNKMAEMKKK